MRSDRCPAGVSGRNTGGVLLFCSARAILASHSAAPCIIILYPFFRTPYIAVPRGVRLRAQAGSCAPSNIDPAVPSGECGVELGVCSKGKPMRFSFLNYLYARYRIGSRFLSLMRESDRKRIKRAPNSARASSRLGQVARVFLIMLNECLFLLCFFGMVDDAICLRPESGYGPVSRLAAG